MNYKIIGKYIKDLKFEISNPKVYFLLEKNISNYKINIDINSHNLKDKIVEIVITLSLSPVENVIEKIITKIVFATIVEIEGDLEDKKKLKEIVLIKVPNEVYAEIRSLFLLLYKKSGFNKINIAENINFKELYLRKSIQ